MIGSFETPNILEMSDINGAITSFCTECAGGKWFVKGCPERDCPLHQYRMGKGTPSPAIIARTCLVSCPTHSSLCSDMDCPLRPYRYER